MAKDRPIIKLAGSILAVNTRRRDNEQGRRIIIQIEGPESFATHAAKISLMTDAVNVAIQERSSVLEKQIEAFVKRGVGNAR